MKILYLDCQSGISGDMFVGAMLDVGLDFLFLQRELSKLKLKGYSLRRRKVIRDSIKGTKFDVLIKNKKRGHRSLKDILNLIDKSALSGDVKELSKNIFLNIGRAEAKAHNTRLDKVHFHEVGYIDSIIDIVGAAIALRKLGIDKVYGSPINSGINAPATLYLLEGLKVNFLHTPHEMVTPTGAAIYKTLVKDIKSQPAIDVSRVGFGAGDSNIDGSPNILRVVMGEKKDSAYGTDKVTVIETNIDDMKPVMYEYVIEKLFEAGALDVFITSTYSKKTRIGILLTVLTKEALMMKMADIIFKETTTIGLRYYQADRFMLKRSIEKVKIKGHTVNVKVSKLDNSRYKFTPEYEDCKKIAKKAGLPLIKVYEN